MENLKKVQISELAVVLISLLLVGSMLFGIVLKKGQQTKDDSQKKKILTEIQGGLEKYFEDEGKYPEKIENLKPTYLTEVPTAVGNYAWVYEPENNGQTYTLKVQLENARLTDDNVMENSGLLFYQLQSKQ